MQYSEERLDMPKSENVHAPTVWLERPASPFDPYFSPRVKWRIAYRSWRILQNNTPAYGKMLLLCSLPESGKDMKRLKIDWIRMVENEPT